ncbi:MAG: patatin-like phospholipase family protein [Caulobacteraceae bacterium]|nr:patatin-like phospholipase family protein [Caulobacter sp.]
MSAPPPGPSHGALQRLFFGRRTPRGLETVAIPGGRTLYAAGDRAEHLFVLKSGRLAVLRSGAAGERVLGVIRPGEPVGEMALIAGAPHSATVIALRDSEVLALPRADVAREARLRPDLMAELAALTVRRAREGEADVGSATVFGLVGASPGVDVRAFVERLAARVRALGDTAVVAGAEMLAEGPAALTRLEAAHDIVLLSAEQGELEWRGVVGRQVDQLILVGRGGEAPPQLPESFAARQLRRHRLVDVVLLHEGDGARRGGAAAWLQAASAAHVFHVREGAYRELARLARVITGRSVGLVLSGGGARAYAHIGAIQALREADQPIDLVGGASMGAIVAAGVAMGWDERELDARVRRAFVESNPLGDLAVPLIGLSRGERMRRRLREHFGEAEFADLELPFFCVSSNLTTGEPQVHRTGRVRRALAASAALPGVAPPVLEGGDVLVDGGVLANLPTDVMRAWHRGPVVGCDVALLEELTPEDVERPSLLRFIASGAWRRGPPIVALLIRAATVTTTRDFAAARAASDLVIAPNIEEVGLQEWRKYQPAMDAGRRAMASALETLDRPLCDLRRPPPRPPSAAADSTEAP